MDRHGEGVEQYPRPLWGVCDSEWNMALHSRYRAVVPGSVSAVVWFWVVIYNRSNVADK